MKNFKIAPCSNCGGTNFTAPDEPKTVAITAANKEDGFYVLDKTKVLGLMSYTCDKCKMVVFFRDNN